MAMGTPDRYSPWDHVDIAWPHITVTTDAPLPYGQAGAWRPGRILLARGLTAAGRRCTLAHELVHLERGAAPMTDARLLQREERTVDAIAARRLIPLGLLIDALRWSPTSLAEVAEECDVDLPTLTARLSGLTDTERSTIEAALHPDDTHGDDLPL